MRLSPEARAKLRCLLVYLLAPACIAAFGALAMTLMALANLEWSFGLVNIMSALWVLFSYLLGGVGALATGLVMTFWIMPKSRLARTAMSGLLGAVISGLGATAVTSYGGYSPGLSSDTGIVVGFLGLLAGLACGWLTSLERFSPRVAVVS